MVEPTTRPTLSADDRRAWLHAAATGFVCPTQANKTIYSWILDKLWPEGHGIPGPVITQAELRAHVDTERAALGQERYKDIFRRVRELQGDEGFTSIRKEGERYQLQSLDVSAKRPPRGAPPKAIWRQAKQDTGNRCSVCGQQEPDIKLSPDHRIPRSRWSGPPHGLNAIENIQPLCEQCNNAKSTQCRGCEQNCQTCPWADPGTYRPIQIADVNREQLRREAEQAGESAQNITNRILRDYFNRRR